MTLYGLVYHISLGRRAEHLVNGQVERTYAVGLLETEAVVAGRFAHHIHRGAFALGNLVYVFDGFFLNQQSHALLALVGNDFLGREGFVAYGQLAHVDVSATFFHQFGEAVHVSGRTVVVDRHYGVYFFFAEGAHHVVGAFLHFGVGTLYGIQLDAAAVTSGINRRY